ncbi:hypothetical protein [Streptomyces acidiscabies]|uniref:Uncharacterized protein n=1 Tax=Streptomyces acidiscabies TaxID=42234 RepID=A0AAP6EL43_9ACTN|nr:hypothetical protein [Streptomyces acidiscabies]MBZ3909814.1 hypothetical protein [Streptomyces acidiscabies]MDX2966917.1 hypothetical protein [Streptomyces acidiscabies]MDX3026017.1 hypothetical protein [Streptomyces acidiscabies]MDX3797021.1 hypothetical protein [Streptomyces acidiscabies]GAQ58811.1 hypothetical protein a10_08707 [Streptomyces acidiscabies]
MRLLRFRAPAVRSYRRWFNHSRTCGSCAGTSRCGTGQNLWDAYRDARAKHGPR